VLAYLPDRTMTERPGELPVEGAPATEEEKPWSPL
jgi:hypothetical protein